MNNKFISKFKYLILAILLVLLLIPKLAFAVIPVTDALVLQALLGSELTESIEEWATAMNTALLVLFILYIVGIGSLLLSAWALQVSLENQGAWMASLTSMTVPAWNFTVGLANLLLVFILLIIAFAFILKIESIQARKTLPRLLIVALLLNFSSVFVRALFDISNIIYNTILSVGGGSLFYTALGPFFNSWRDIISFLATWFAILLAQTIPISGALAQIAFVLGFNFVFLPDIISWVFQAFVFFFLSSLFLLYAFLFVARVFVVQILTILSPIAFLALILPQTRSHWNDWFKQLTSWLLLGVFLLFFLVVGFKSMVYLNIGGFSPTTPFPLPFFSWVELFKNIFYYFAIFTYLAVILFISKKYLPELVDVLISLGQQAAGFIMTKGLKPFGRAAEIETRESLSKWEGAQKWAEKLAYAPQPKTKNPLKTFSWAIQREVGKAVGPSTQEFMLKKVHEYEQKYRGKGTKRQVAALESLPYTFQKSGVLQAAGKDENYEDLLHEKGYELKDYEDEKKRNEILEKLHFFDIYGLAKQLQERAILRAIEPSGVAEFKTREEVEKREREHPGVIVGEEKRKEIYKEMMKEVMAGIRTEHLPLLPLTVLHSPEFMEEMVKQPPVRFLPFMQRFGSLGQGPIENTITRLAVNEKIEPSAFLQKYNLKTFDYLTSSYGQGYISFKEMNKEFYKQTLGIEELNEKIETLNKDLEGLNEVLESKEKSDFEKTNAFNEKINLEKEIKMFKEAVKEKEEK